jgi:hypothetical protein
VSLTPRAWVRPGVPEYRYSYQALLEELLALESVARTLFSGSFAHQPELGIQSTLIGLLFRRASSTIAVLSKSPFSASRAKGYCSFHAHPSDCCIRRIRGAMSGGIDAIPATKVPNDLSLCGEALPEPHPFGTGFANLPRVC